eukprot:CAMPEP_0174307650 /NCGR_PEP_ID=MMETSP0810-20121108/1257_1 /TAXON_ID=73025 ORGANISM="Eutreptiella gymnastica-like, Strain CCMP1594" /NCGR_SAMPLE_ID=MMETSP0810 /ASSEMBLY_ACC=CAM_ASM_000659 /LENGTH=547 /DNA_ID=CAMNT_0015414765 /DNA_START=12 /DNA_END=1655 /DNA_ORIENTATION=-
MADALAAISPAPPPRRKRSHVSVDVSSDGRSSHHGEDGKEQEQESGDQAAVNQFTFSPDQRTLAQRKIGALIEVQQICLEVRKIANTIREAQIYDITNAKLSQWSAEISDRIDSIEEQCRTISAADIAAKRKLDVAAARLNPANVGLSQARTANPATPRLDVSAAMTSSWPRNRGLAGKLDAAPRAMSHHQLVTTGLYLTLEAVADQLQAERAVVFQYQSATDDLLAVSAVGFSAASGFKAQNHRLSATTGLAGAVYSSGIGINVSNAYADVGFDMSMDKKTGLRTHNLLCFPVRSLDNSSTTGVVQVINKNKGVVQFNKVDEARLNAHSGLLGYIMQQYPVDLVSNYFDPKPLHAIVPLRPHDGEQVLLRAMGARAPGPQLVFRTTHSGQHFKRKNINDNALVDLDNDKEAANIQEVDEYIRKLEECWRNSVHMNIQLSDENEAKVQQLRQIQDDRRRYRKGRGSMSRSGRSNASRSVGPRAPEDGSGDFAVEEEHLPAAVNPLLDAPKEVVEAHFASIKTELRTVLAESERWMKSEKVYADRPPK